MSTARWISVLLVAASMSVPALAQVALDPQTQNGVAFVSGGIGDEGMQAIRAAEPGYNLRLLFAVRGTGQYLADVKVTIEDAKGRVLVQVVSDGPYFLAKLSPGTYKIVAENAGKVVAKSVEVPAGRAASTQALYWPAGG